MHRLTVFCFLASHAFAFAGYQEDRPAEMTRVQLGAANGISLTFTYQKHASFADQQWIGFELKNTSGAPVRFKTDYFVLMGEYSHPGGQPIGSGDLASGAIAGTVAPHATAANFKTPRMYNAASLGWTDVPVTLNATLVGDLVDTEGHILFKADYPNPVKFRFFWQPVRDDRIASVRARFDDLLTRPKLDQFEEGYVFGNLLKADPIGGKITTERLIQTVRGKPDDINRTRNILEYLVQKRVTESATLNYFV